MTEPSVLIAEDDPELRSVLRRGLAEQGFAPEAVGTGGELLARVDSESPDLLIIDIGLPDTDGRDLCQALRARGIQAPVLFLTARDALPDRLSGFDAGGGDYVTKPVVFARVVPRLQALARPARAAGGIETPRLRLAPNP